MMEMAQVYQVFANQGKKVSLVGITKIEDQEGNIIFEAEEVAKRSESKLRKDDVELINEGLKAVVRYGTGYKVRHLSGKAAGKTGTSNKSKDNWFCGFTDDLVIITWMGNDDQNSFSGRISSSNTAAPLWARFAGRSINHLKTKRLARSRNVEVAKIHPVYGHRSHDGVLMPFRRGQAPKKEKSDLMALDEGQKLRVSLHEL